MNPHRGRGPRPSLRSPFACRLLPRSPLKLTFSTGPLMPTVRPLRGPPSAGVRMYPVWGEDRPGPGAPCVAHSSVRSSSPGSASTGGLPGVCALTTGTKALGFVWLPGLQPPSWTFGASGG